MVRCDTVQAAHSLVSSERAKIMEPPSIGLRLNYTRVRARVSLFRMYGTLARTHTLLPSCAYDYKLAADHANVFSVIRAPSMVLARVTK